MIGLNIRATGTRDLLMHQRTMTLKAARAHLAEFEGRINVTSCRTISSSRAPVSANVTDDDQRGRNQETRGSVRAAKPDSLSSTRRADFIKASGHLHRTDRPET